jgi:hypothetical protein
MGTVNIIKGLSNYYLILCVEDIIELEKTGFLPPDSKLYELQDRIYKETTIKFDIDTIVHLVERQVLKRWYKITKSFMDVEDK